EVPGCCMRAFRRIELFVPGSVVIVPQTSVSGPYWVPLRQPVQVVEREQASAFETTLSPLSPVPRMLFDQPFASGFSSGRFYFSRIGSGGWGAAPRSGGPSLAGGPPPTPLRRRP